MNRCTICRGFIVCLAAALIVAAAGMANAGPINVDLVPVGDPGNAADSSGFGAVSYPYSIGKYDVTTSQYAAFLNAVAATDTFGLWNSHMASDLPTVGISRSGSAGSFTYSVIGNGNVPIFDETWGVPRGSPIGCRTASRPVSKDRERPRQGPTRSSARPRILL